MNKNERLTKMTLGWNWLGILLWVVLILYLVFIVQNIRKRHLQMIIRYRKRFDAKTFSLDIVELLVLFVGLFLLVRQTFFDNPDLANREAVTSKIEYRPLILSTGAHSSYYVTAHSEKKTRPAQSYSFYSDGNHITVDSRYATISSGTKPSAVNAAMIPYSKKELAKADRHYQKAFMAVYTARYKNNWRNGLGLHAGRIAVRYYLLRVPDDTFIRDK